jgi:hypothetical protein
LAIGILLEIIDDLLDAAVVIGELCVCIHSLIISTQRLFSTRFLRFLVGTLQLVINCGKSCDQAHTARKYAIGYT